jgi:hypothetical protein
MSKASEYRDYAAQCMRLVQSAAGNEERDRWSTMADRWMKWADAEEQKEKANPKQSAQGRG